MIPCTQSCIYQDSGSCGLNRAAPRGNADGADGDCAYLIQRAEPPARVPLSTYGFAGEITNAQNKKQPKPKTAPKPEKAPDKASEDLTPNSPSFRPLIKR